MNISDLKDLEKLMKLCRKQGIESITIDGIVLKFDTYFESRRVISKSKPEKEYVIDPTENVKIESNIPSTPDKIETDGLTEEQMLYYSAVPHDVGNQ